MQKNGNCVSEILISFCIPVYNQYELVQDCINSIIAYKGSDIEVIISDDNSTEKIDELVEQFNDARVHYFRNEVNLGHDRNILQAMERANGRYAFVLRTRDKIIAENITKLLDIAKQDKYSYITGCALDQYGRVRLPYSERRYQKGEEALQLHFDLFIHPSGNMYRLKNVDIERLRSFLDGQRISKTGFIVHNMIRIMLAEAGDFYVISKPVWIYSYTLEHSDRAVNCAENQVSVYNPKLTYERFEYESNWIKQIVLPENVYSTYLRLISLYLNTLTWGFKLVNSDQRAQYHYKFKKIKFSVWHEQKRMEEKILKEYDCCFGVSKQKYILDLKYIFVKNQLVGAINYIVKKFTMKTPFYNGISAAYKKYIKRL